jgi:hypothetical protein
MLCDKRVVRKAQVGLGSLMGTPSMFRGGLYNF